jgi:hypothetical protein
MAKEQLSLCAPPGERPIRPSHVRYLTECLDGGRLHSCQWGRAVCKETGKEYGVNGRHSATAAVRAETLPRGLSVVIDHFTCDTVAELAEIFSDYDTILSTRTSAEIALSYGRAAGIKGLGGSVLYKCGAGIAYGLHNADPQNPSLDANGIGALLLTHKKSIEWLGQFATIRRLSRTGVLAAMFLTRERSDLAANAFWPCVRDGVSKGRGDPAGVLNAWLTEQSGNPTVGRAEKREYYVRCVHGWNAYRQGHQLQLIRYSRAAPLPDIK